LIGGCAGRQRQARPRAPSSFALSVLDSVPALVAAP
jgi:hypothetical protein